ncbi:MAG: RluA family pseudouridine synthase [candidate division Zixibacteria bacterium]|nr:RluA family pseudouridine synthase [candidate division Zixibacteria bacterium]NIR68004.1 RluA family pseudouridine synthase [candidate division Zixibacteria bacterium]NIS17504.1 RluA family pseudouridine synthase [candidate division Zixibacteria bacterium]NIS49210.1 RluA family pseudouridine synthase [candidate division Zixibacteria bacterium]NIT53813.1 RluA family pseudouridine synthase [candidate division Zixibacteria bacterium]
MDQFSITVNRDGEGERIDHYLVVNTKGLSRTKIQKLIKEGFITVNNDTVKSNFRLSAGDEIEGTIPPVREFKLEPETIPLDIKFEDEYLLVLNKPAGLVVHPGTGNWAGTLLNGLLHYLGDKGELSGERRPALVHRLDKETSGLLIAAKDEPTLNYMQLELKKRRIKRRYQALVWGHLREEQAVINFPIGRLPTDRRKMTVDDESGRDATTRYVLLERYKFIDHVDISLQTGRTHQIRVHFSHLGHPVVGDSDYGGDDKILQGLFDQYRMDARKVLAIMRRQALHAWRLEFRHPRTGLIHAIKSELPDDIMKVLSYIKEIDSKL